jgi:hypothetical protein
MRASAKDGLRSERIRAVGRILGTAAVVATLAGTAQAEDRVSKSAEAAALLTKQLEQAKLQYIAVKDPSEDGRFIAAVHFPGTNLMVISARYAAPALINEKLILRKFQEAYVDLNAASERASRIFVEDMLANGFPMSKKKDQPTDAFETSGKRIVFDFDWRKQKLTQDEYFSSLSSADEQYTRMLKLLMEAAQAK